MVVVLRLSYRKKKWFWVQEIAMGDKGDKE
jgi:hypothetical protein